MMLIPIPLSLFLVPFTIPAASVLLIGRLRMTYMPVHSDTSYKGSVSIYLKNPSKQTQPTDENKSLFRKHFADFPAAESSCLLYKMKI